MNPNLRYFYLALFLSLPLWWGINMLHNELEVFFVWQMVKNDSKMFLAQAGISPIEIVKPIRSSAIEDLNPQDFSAKSMLAVEIHPGAPLKRTLFYKNPKEKLPIASLSKLMTADIVLRNLDLLQSIEISKEAVAQEETLGQLKAGEVLLAHDLLYIALMESSNDAAYALAEEIGIEEFLQKMNDQAKNLGMQDTSFANLTGVDPDNALQLQTYSTALDSVELTRYLLGNSPKIWEILNTDLIDLYGPDGKFHHTLINTNKLFGKIPRLVGAKTGWTPLARGCLLLVQKSPKDEGFLVYVILGSEDRFGEMERLVKWVNEAWRW